MAKKFLTAVDMTGNELQNARAQNLASAPGSPQPGWFWYNTTTGRIEFRGASATIDPTQRSTHQGTQLSSTISDFDAQVRSSRLDQMAAPTASVSAGSQKIINLATPTLASDACTKAYADAITTSIPTYRLDQFAAPTASVSLNSQKITNLAAPTLGSDACTKTYADAIATSIPTYRLDQFAAPTASLSMNSQKLTNLGAPVSANDAVRLTDLQGIQNGLVWKTPARVATTANINISAPGAAIDGITMNASERVLVRANTAQAENGLYLWNGAAAAMTRTTDGVTGTLLSGSVVPVLEGVANADSAFRLNTDGTITVGTTAQSWGPFANPFTPVQGTGISISGSTISADTTVLVRKYSQLIGDGSTTAIAVTHSLGTTDVTVGVYEVSSGAEVECDKTRTSSNVVTFGFLVAPTSNQYKVVIHG